MGPSRGWNNIGYGYLVAPDGTVYEGRGFEIVAAHSPGKNHEPSVALIGDYSTRPPTEAQHRAVYALKALLDAGDLRGHRENTATSCPGDAAMAKIVKGPPPKQCKLQLSSGPQCVRFTFSTPALRWFSRASASISSVISRP